MLVWGHPYLSSVHLQATYLKGPNIDLLLVTSGHNCRVNCVPRIVGTVQVARSK